jgi:hypothetical protein
MKASKLRLIIWMMEQTSQRIHIEKGLLTMQLGQGVSIQYASKILNQMIKELKMSTVVNDVADKALIVAARLRGYKLAKLPGGFLAVYKKKDGCVEPVAAWVRFKEVANLCGATGSITLRQAAERDGLKWPIQRN